MTITKLEAIVLDNIARNCYQPTNYGKPESFRETADIWSNLILDSGAKEKVPVRSLPGICSSLAKKGLVTTSEVRDDSTIGLTEAGFAAWQASVQGKRD